MDGGGGKDVVPKSGGSGSGLNPYAKEWRPENRFDNQDMRCLFLTFSNGFPLTEHQIFSFFNLKYGPCVERVYVHRRRGREKKTLFGKVVFKSSYMPLLVLKGHPQRRFQVDGRPLWCKPFDPNKTTKNGSQ